MNASIEEFDSHRKVIEESATTLVSGCLSLSLHLVLKDWVNPRHGGYGVVIERKNNRCSVVMAVDPAVAGLGFYKVWDRIEDRVTYLETTDLHQVYNFLNS